MSKSDKEAIAIFTGLCLALLFMLWLTSYDSACIKTDNDNKVIFVDDLLVTNAGISYSHNGIKYHSTSSTYVYANDPISCDEIFPQEN